MALDIRGLLFNIPEVRKPSEKNIDFNTKLKWTLIILAAFFVLGNIDLYGTTPGFLENFAFLQTILASQFGTIISLGIGPIVMSSIILQLLAGSGLLNIDTKTPDGQRYFQGLQKVGVIFFIVFEAIVYVVMGGIQANPGYTGIVIGQLILGGVAIMYMDEVLQKYGFKNGGGVSLFIVAGVAWSLFTGLFQFTSTAGENCLANFSTVPCSGSALVVIQSLISGAPTDALAAGSIILATAAVFLIIVWAQALKVEIPLSYERLRGYGMKWPLQFFYTSTIPVILVAALAANVQLFGGLLEGWLGHPTFLGGFSNGTPISGLAFWLSSTNIVQALIRGSLQTSFIWQAIVHILFYMIFSAVFAIFWVKTSGMDEATQAKNILSSGLQLPGFRKDPRVLEAVLKRYILPLTVMGGLAIGLLGGGANVVGVLTGGTSILLAVMIMYNLYQGIAQQHAVDMHPAMRKFIG